MVNTGFGKRDKKTIASKAASTAQTVLINELREEHAELENRYNILVDGSNVETLDQLVEFAKALNEDPDFVLNLAKSVKKAVDNMVTIDHTVVHDIGTGEESTAGEEPTAGENSQPQTIAGLKEFAVVPRLVSTQTEHDSLELTSLGLTDTLYFRKTGDTMNAITATLTSRADDESIDIWEATGTIVVPYIADKIDDNHSKLGEVIDRLNPLESTETPIVNISEAINRNLQICTAIIAGNNESDKLGLAEFKLPRLKHTNTFSESLTVEHTHHGSSGGIFFTARIKDGDSTARQLDLGCLHGSPQAKVTATGVDQLILGTETDADTVVLHSGAELLRFEKSSIKFSDQTKPDVTTGRLYADGAHLFYNDVQLDPSPSNGLIIVDDTIMIDTGKGLKIDSNNNNQIAIDTGAGLAIDGNQKLRIANGTVSDNMLVVSGGVLSTVAALSQLCDQIIVGRPTDDDATWALPRLETKNTFTEDNTFNKITVNGKIVGEDNDYEFLKIAGDGLGFSVYKASDVARCDFQHDENATMRVLTKKNPADDDDIDITLNLQTTDGVNLNPNSAMVTASGGAESLIIGSVNNADTIVWHSGDELLRFEKDSIKFINQTEPSDTSNRLYAKTNDDDTPSSSLFYNGVQLGTPKLDPRLQILLDPPPVVVELLSRTTTKLVFTITPPSKDQQLWFLPNDHRVKLNTLQVNVYDDSDSNHKISRTYQEVYSGDNGETNSLYELLGVTLDFEKELSDSTSTTNPGSNPSIGCKSLQTGGFKVEMGYVSNAFPHSNALSTLSGLSLVSAGYAQAVPNEKFSVATSEEGNRRITVTITSYAGLDCDLAAPGVQATPGLNGVLVGIFGIKKIDGRAVTKLPLPTDITGDFNVGNVEYNASRVQSFPSTTPTSVTFENVGYDMQFRAFVMVKNNTQVAGNTETTSGKYETTSLAFSKIHDGLTVLGQYSQGVDEDPMAVVANTENDNGEVVPTVVHKDEGSYSEFEYDIDEAYDDQDNDFLAQFPDRTNFTGLSFTSYSTPSDGDSRSYSEVTLSDGTYQLTASASVHLYRNTGAATLTMTLSDIQVPKYGTSIDKLGVVILKIGGESVTIAEPITSNDTPWNLSGGLQSSNLRGGSVTQAQNGTHFGMDAGLTYTVTDVHPGDDYKENVFIDLEDLVATVAITTSTTRDTDYTIGASYTHPVINSGNPNDATSSRIYRFIDRPPLTQSIVSFTCSESHLVCGRQVVGKADGEFKFVVTVKLESSSWRYIPGDLNMYKLKIDNITTNPSNFVKLGVDNPDSNNTVSLATNTNDFTFTHTVTKVISGIDSPITASVAISSGLDYFYDVGLGGTLDKTGRMDSDSRQHVHHLNTNVGENGERLELTGDPYTNIKGLLGGDITANTHLDSNLDDSDYFKNIGLTDAYLLDRDNFNHDTSRVATHDLLMHNGEYYFPGNNYKAAYTNNFTESFEHTDQNRFILLRYDNIGIDDRFVVLKFDTSETELNARLTDKMYMWAKVVVTTTDKDTQSLHWNSVQFVGEGIDGTTTDAGSEIFSYTRANDKGMRMDLIQLSSDLGPIPAAAVQEKKKSVLINTSSSWETDDSSEKHLFVLLVCLEGESEEFTNITAEGFSSITSAVVDAM